MLEKVARITRVVFDKTGTLTAGFPYLVRVNTPHGEDASKLTLFLALLAESQSEHPIGRAIVSELEKRIGSEVVAQLKEQHEVEMFTNYDGEGIEPRVRDRTQDRAVTVLVGNEKLMQRAGAEPEAEIGVRELQQ